MAVKWILGRTKEVNLKVSSVLEEVLFALNIENWGSEIFELSSCLRHLELLWSLHDFLKLWKQTGREDILGSKLEPVKNGHAETRVFFVLHSYERNSVSLTCLLVNWNLDVCGLNLQLLLFKCAFNQSHKLGNFVLFTLGQVVDHEVVREIVVELGRVSNSDRVDYSHRVLLDGKTKEFAKLRLSFNFGVK